MKVLFKKKIYWMGGLLLLILLATFLTFNDVSEIHTSIAIDFTIEEKQSHIEPGKYLEMWVVGSNANDSDPNKIRYKVMIDDARIFNLIEEGKSYFVSINGSKNATESEFVYTLGQIGIIGGTQMRGKGEID